MRKIMIVFGAALLLAVSIGLAAEASPTTVAVRGGEQFVPNALIQSTFRFSPGPISVSSGQEVTWVNAGQVAEPHTVTIVDQSDLPTDVEEAIGPEGCGAPGKPCGDALAAHFSTDPPTLVLDPDDDGGLDAPGDSLLLLPGGSISATVTAPAGTTLFYLCAIHPWMQGSITVG
jgi:plastocyanin